MCPHGGHGYKPHTPSRCLGADGFSNRILNDRNTIFFCYYHRICSFFYHVICFQIPNNIKEKRMLFFSPPRSGDGFWSLRIFCRRIWKPLGYVPEGSPAKKQRNDHTQNSKAWQEKRGGTRFTKKRKHFNFLQNLSILKGERNQTGFHGSPPFFLPKFSKRVSSSFERLMISAPCLSVAPESSKQFPDIISLVLILSPDTLGALSCICDIIGTERGKLHQSPCGSLFKCCV